MFKVIKSNEGELRKISENKFALNLITKDITSNFSLARTEGKDYFEKGITKYERIYYVLNGTLNISIEGIISALLAGDSIYLSNGTEYEMSGNFNALVVNCPAFGSIE